MSCKLDGFAAHVSRDGTRARIVPTTGLRKHLTHGDFFRIGGVDTDAATTLIGTNGDTPVDTVNVDIGSPVVRTTSTAMAVGEKFRIGGHVHSLQRVGAEIQSLTLTDATQTTTGYHALELTHNDVVTNSSCLDFATMGAALATQLCTDFGVAATSLARWK